MRGIKIGANTRDEARKLCKGVKGARMIQKPYLGFKWTVIL